MGEVWRARDTKLGREVAIKTLPEEFARDEERLARFGREARLLASLNHPNIATIYGLEEDNGTRFLVLELVEGDTLADRLKKGAIAVEESLKLALQIAEALEAAHEKGVIHRDLKPANIKVTPDGKIKVLDFGLAKAFAGDGADVNLSQSPTLSMAATQQGVILGTAAYMSPEQARGQEVDKRADVWAFGCVLYEMVTGQQTWAGPTVTDMIAAAVAKDPDFTTLPVNIHPRIQELLRRCLEKEPKNRWQAIGDVRVEVEQLLGHPDGLLVRPVVDVQEPPRPILPWVGGAVAVTAIITAIAFLSLQPDPPTPDVVRFLHNLPGDQTLTAPNRWMNVFVSPDGRNIGYVANNQLWIRSIGAVEAQPVPGTDENHLPIFSPDGQWIAYWAEGRLKKVQIGGGTPVTLCAASNATGIDWYGDTIYFGQGLATMSVSENGGTPDLVIGDGNGSFVLPGGKAIMFNSRSTESSSGWQTWAQSFETGERTLLVPDGVRVHASIGHLTYYLDSTVFAVPFDLENVEVLAGAVPVVENVVPGPNPSFPLSLAVSANGTVVYLAGVVAPPRRNLVWVDREGNEEILSPEPGNYDFPVLSPQRSMVVYFDYQSGNEDIWTYDIETGTPRQETFFDGVDQVPGWSPDGDFLWFTSARDGTDKDIFLRRMDPRGEPERLLERPSDQFATSSSPDGRTLAFHEYEQGAGGSQDIYTLSVDTAEVTPFVTTEANERGAMFAPNGEWIAYVSDELGVTEVFVMPFPADPGGRVRISYEGGSEPRWSVDGSELFYRDGTSLIVVEIDMGAGLERGPARPLFPDSYRDIPNGNVTDYDIDFDGSRFLMVKEGETETPEINIILNWFEELKERAPVP